MSTTQPSDNARVAMRSQVQAWLPGLEAPVRQVPARQQRQGQQQGQPQGHPQQQPQDRPQQQPGQWPQPPPASSQPVLAKPALRPASLVPHRPHQPDQRNQPDQPDQPLLVPGVESLHPAVWRAHQLGRHGQAVQSSGFTELDAQLPGGGWPAQVLTELLLPHPGVGELRLLAPVLASVQQQQRCVMWFDPPAAPCAWTLGALGIDVRQLVLVHARQLLKSRARQLLPAADILWAVEQALKSGHVGALLAWLPGRLPADALRRLQLAAQAHEGPVFLLRDAPAHLRAGSTRPSSAGWAAALPPSPAPLRLLLGSAGPDMLSVRLLKRRGPPLADALTLVLPPVLSEPALERARQMAATATHAHSTS